VTKRRNAGIVAVATGAVGAVVAGALAAEHRAVGRARSQPDPYAHEPFGSLHTEGIDVVASDGVVLHVEIDGDANLPLTVVFVHGFSLSMDAYYFQRRDLGDLGRLVFFDLRSHGRSEVSAPENCTIDQLGLDLYAVLQAVAPSGPVMLVGHSLGGMSILALADAHPELFGDRITGVALLSTSTGGLAKTIVGLPGWASRVVSPAVPPLAKAAGRRASTLERGRRLGSDLAFVATRFLSFGPDAPPSLVEFMERLLLATSIETMAQFFDTLLEHDKLEALEVLSDIPVLISCGTRDRLTPVSHSEIMALRLPEAELQVLPDAGHVAFMDRHVVVNAALHRLADRMADRSRSDLAG
jgi:pimeloyl-ACP methyl ester carboxylesterase